MALNVGNLVATLGMDKKGFDTGIEDAQEKTKSFAAGFAANLKSLAVPIAVAGAAVGAAATYGVKKFADFEEGMNQVFTLMPDASAEARDKMIADVKAISSEMGIMTTDAVSALYEALGAGVLEDNVFSFIETAQKAAVGGATSLETTVDGLTSVVNAYGGDVLDAATAADILFQGIKVGKSTFAELSRSLYNVTPTAAGLGIGFGDISAALAAMTAQGVPTATATTQLRQLLIELSKSGSKTAKMFETLTGQSFKDFIASGENVQDALKILETYAADTGLGINDLFGSVEAGSAALALTGKGTELFSTALADMETAAGATEAAYQQMEGGINRQLEKISADINVIMLDLAGAIAPLVSDYILPAVRGAIDAFKDMMEWFGKAAPALDPLKDVIQNALAPAVEYFQDKLTDLGDWWDAHSAAFVGVWDAISASAQWAIEKIVTPIGSALVPVIDFFQDRLAHMFDWWEENSAVFIKAWENIGAAIEWVVNSVIVPLFEWAWPYIEDIYSGVLDTMLGVAKLFASILAGDWEAAGEALVDITKGAMSALVGVASMGWDAVATGIEFVGQGIADFVYAMWANIVQATEDAINSMIDRINEFLKAINSVTESVGISVPVLSHISFQADKIKAPKIEIPRWSDTSSGKAIGEFLSSGNEDEEDIDAEFEDAEEKATEPAQSLKDQVKTDPPIREPEKSTTRPPATTTQPAPELAVAQPTPAAPVVTVPAIETPVPVTVENWPGHVPDKTPPGEAPVVSGGAPEIPATPETEPSLVEVLTPAVPDVDVEALGVTVPAPKAPTVDLPTITAAIPVTVTNWPDYMRPAPAPEILPVGEDEPEQPDEDDIDEEFDDSPAAALVKFLAAIPKVIIPPVQVPDISGIVPNRPPAADVGYRTGAPIQIGGGETRVVVELDGNVVGEALFRTWNRRAGGALNG